LTLYRRAATVAPEESRRTGWSGAAAENAMEAAMRTWRTVGAVTAALVSLAVPGAAQEPDGALAAVEQIFDGMRTANPEMVRAAFASDARFAMVDARAAGVGVQSVDGWIDAIGQSERRWDEQIYDLDVKVDGNMASIWAPYTFYLDGAVRHCGINSIELLHDGDGWKITQISDTRRTEGCPDPLGEAPR
jgi:hypothetical protein